ncbi:outer membrane beta-barrel protein [Desertibaculum subflavum]|uniref:outer membrane beta-barrel protein n=1 Tax=Desertibaculum subflavum TaxID=2268458 RepID=UPI0013C4D0DC
MLFIGSAPADTLAEDRAPELFPEMGPTLEANPDPVSIDLGASLGRLYVTGVVSGLGLWQSNPFAGNDHTYADIGNAMVTAQTEPGVVQFVAQAGLYSMPTLGEPYTRSTKLNSRLYGPLPIAYAKFAPDDGFSVQIGRLPTLLGAEWDWTYQNVNIERGLLWNQENSINQGIQVNYAAGPVELSLSLNDGFFSGKFHWLTGAATYAIDDDNWLTLSAGGALRSSGIDTFRTPLAQNNSVIVNLIYEAYRGPWSITPYLQYTHVPNNHSMRSAGFTDEASTYGAALIVAYAFDENWKLAARGEYIASSGSDAKGAPELVTGGPGADNWSFTLTPTYQYKTFFARAEFSYVGLGNVTPDFGFGKSGNDKSQVRVLFETGFIF